MWHPRRQQAATEGTRGGNRGGKWVCVTEFVSTSQVDLPALRTLMQRICVAPEKDLGTGDATDASSPPVDSVVDAPMAQPDAQRDRCGSSCAEGYTPY